MTSPDTTKLMPPHRRELVYAALGDSTGVGVGADSGGGYPDRLLRRLMRLKPEARLVNFCQSGALSSDVLAEQVPQALQARPELITLCIGINDVSADVPEEWFAVNLEESVRRLRQTGARLLISNLPDLALSPAAVGFPPALFERHIEMINEHIAASALRNGVLLVDLFTASRASLAGRPELFCEDGFHPSAEGYETWAEILWPALETMLDEEPQAALLH